MVDVTALDAFLKQKRQALRLPGLAVAVVHGGRIAYLCGLGVAGPGRSMTAQTPLIIGSLSKSFTALAVMQLVEAGKLDLDIPIRRYVPWFCLADATESARITTRHLLTHTSGISRYDGRVLLAGRGNKTLEHSVQELSPLKLTQPVGTAFQYSNTNYMIAGLVVERVSGQPFAEYLQQNILGPLSMQQSYVSEDAARRGGLATGYCWWFGLPVPFRAPYLDDALPAAFVAASAQDMARYVLALLNGGALDGASVLSAVGVAELHRPQVAATASPGSSYGLGWRIEQLGGVSVLRHGGEVSNFLAEMVLVPGLGLGVVALMNANNGMVPLVTQHDSRLASSVARFLLNMPQPKSRLSQRGFYALLDAGLVGLSLYQGWSLVRLLRSSGSGSGQRERSALGLAALFEIGLAAIALRGIPRLADAPWRLLRLYVPDVTSWVAIFSCGSLVKFALVLGRLLRSRH